MIKQIAAAVLFAVIVTSVVGGLILLGTPAPVALLTGLLVAVLIRLDDARIRRARARAKD